MLLLLHSVALEPVSILGFSPFSLLVHPRWIVPHPSCVFCGLGGEARRPLGMARSSFGSDFNATPAKLAEENDGWLRFVDSHSSTMELWMNGALS